MNLVRLIAALAAATLLAACAGVSPPKALVVKPLPDERPPDLVLSATVFSPSLMQGAKLPRSLQPSRYVVEADGILRAAIGPGASSTTFPSQTRQLTPRQFDGLWRLIRESGLLDSGSSARVDDPESIVREPARTTAVFFVTFGGERATLRITLDRSSETAVNAEKILDRLAELAWVKD